jgi:GntR family transcriptional repressor for pyruvate dehydrogenase complex
VDKSTLPLDHLADRWSEPLPRARLSDRVADQIMKSILSRGMVPGDRLPTEREFSMQFGVSRTVIREAVRSLETRGILAAGPGRGLRVAAVDSANVSESISLFVRGRMDLNYDEVSEVRAMVEVQVAGLAAERATADDLARLEDACSRLEHSIGTDAESPADVAFHRVIAETTHNALYALMLDSIADVLVESRRLSQTDPGESVGVGAHRLVLEAITDHDPQRSRHAMRAHLDQADKVYRRRIARTPESPA